MDKIERLIQFLNSPDNGSGSRWMAINDIGEIRDPRIVDGLVKALMDRADIVWKAAAETLVGFGKTAVPALIGTLKDERDHVRNGGLLTLSRLVVDNNIPLPHIRESFQAFIDKSRIEDAVESEKLKRRAAEMYKWVAGAVVANREPMAKDMLPARIKPKGKGKIYRMRRFA